MRDKGAQPLGFSLLAALSNLPAERIYNQDLQNVGALEYFEQCCRKYHPWWTEAYVEVSRTQALTGEYHGRATIERYASPTFGGLYAGY